jgi:hypothetical protein
MRPSALVEAARCGRLNGWGAIMVFAKPIDTAELDKATDTEVEGNIRELVRRDSAGLRQSGDGSDSEMIANNVGSLLRRVTGTSTREIDNLINELQNLRDKLRTDGNRVQRDIVEYAALSQSVMQLTKIISESLMQVKKRPDAPSISG